MNNKLVYTGLEDSFLIVHLQTNLDLYLESFYDKKLHIQ